MARVRHGRRHPPFGATQKQAERFLEQRKLKNRIFELEQQLKLQQEDAARRGFNEAISRYALVLEEPRLKALRDVCNAPARKVLEMNLLPQWGILCHTLESLELIASIHRSEVASGK